MSDDKPESLQDLLVMLSQLTAAIAETKAELEPITEEHKSITQHINQVRNDWAEQEHLLLQQIQAGREARDKAVAEEAERQAKLEAAKWDIQRNLRKAQMEADSLQRRIDQARRAAERASEWATLEQRWDLLTMGAPWREWAKDHQIQGAKKITYEGRLILGDTMGLGKTLTSLIAIDMIEAATKDASPESPVEFGSMK